MYRENYRHWFALVGRILMACIFLVSAYAKMSEWHGTLGMLAAKGMPAAPILLGLATLIELFGGLSLLTGFYTRTSSLILFLYLIPVTLVFHNFWAVGPAQFNIQLVNFLKNLAIMGGLLGYSAYGPGRFSIGKERYAYEEGYGARTRERATTASGAR